VSKDGYCRKPAFGGLAVRWSTPYVEKSTEPAHNSHTRTLKEGGVCKLSLTQLRAVVSIGITKVGRGPILPTAPAVTQDEGEDEDEDDTYNDTNIKCILYGN
jgi:hypothetical protein